MSRSRKKSEETSHSFERLLEYLRSHRGFDFSGYKRSSLSRRIVGRMNTIGVRTFEEYIKYLETHSDEFPLLFNTILINVTAFFRDAPAWEYLADQVLPKIAEAKRKDDPIRCWCAGCASGEEAYTLAMLLSERLGADGFRQRAKIYATDIDEDALASARSATYTVKAMEDVPPALRDKYFERAGAHYSFRNDLRRQVIFGRHDLVQDAPISKLDLLVVRNTLMYFTSETQDSILTRLHFALNPGGYLFLGRAEMLLARSKLFVPVNLRLRIFGKAPGTATVEQRLAYAYPRLSVPRHDERAATLREEAVDYAPWAQLIIDAKGNMVMANRQARSAFDIKESDMGRPFRDLEISYRPVELRSVIDRVVSEGTAAKINDTEWHGADGKKIFWEINASPIFLKDNAVSGVSISFIDVTPYHELQEEVALTKNELETTNEELQSTVEELQTTNEELQSANEEMETMNEELQATNEELTTTNDELRERTDDLNRADVPELDFQRSAERGDRDGPKLPDHGVDGEDNGHVGDPERRSDGTVVLRSGHRDTGGKAAVDDQEGFGRQRQEL